MNVKPKVYSVAKLFSVFLLLLSSFVLLGVHSAFSNIKRKKPECDSLVFPVEWSIRTNSNDRIVMDNINGIYWVDNAYSAEIRTPADSSIFGLDCSARNSFSITGKLHCRLKKDYVYRLKFDVKADYVDSILFNVGFSILPTVEGEVAHFPRFTLSRFETDSMKAHEWKAVEFLFVATGVEESISIEKKFWMSKKGKSGPHIALIRNLHLERSELPGEDDPLNFIVNGNLELYKSCPHKLLSGDYCMYYWQKEREIELECISSRDNGNTVRRYIDLGTPDLYSVCSRLEYKMPMPFSGRSYALLSLYPFGLKSPAINEDYTGEFLQCELKDTLAKDSLYRITFAYMKSPGSNVATNSLGIRFTTCPFSMDSYNYQSIMPNGQYFVSDSVNTNAFWTVANIEFVAMGTEKYFVVGPFRKNGKEETVVKTPVTGMGLTGYYYVDDFRLEKIEHKK